MADIIITTDTQQPRPLFFTPVGATWKGDKCTNTEARRLLRELRDWAKQFNHPEAQKLDDGLHQVERLFSAVWTEIDESLTHLSLAKTYPHKADEYITNAMLMLNRWQDRNGRIGNVVSIDDKPVGARYG